MNADTHLQFLLGMKRIAKEARSRHRRIHYRSGTKEQALAFAGEVERAGGSLEDAAELMSMHKQTLLGWLDRATTPAPEPEEVVLGEDFRTPGFRVTVEVQQN